MNEITVGLIDLALLLILFLTGIELGFAMAIMGFVGFATSSPSRQRSTSSPRTPSTPLRATASR